MISSTPQLEEFLGSCNDIAGQRVCAIDTEANSLHRHKESLCLIQFSAGEESILIDPLAIDDLSPSPATSRMPRSGCMEPIMT